MSGASEKQEYTAGVKRVTEARENQVNTAVARRVSGWSGVRLAALGLGSSGRNLVTFYEVKFAELEFH